MQGHTAETLSCMTSGALLRRSLLKSSCEARMAACMACPAKNARQNLLWVSCACTSGGRGLSHHAETTVCCQHGSIGEDAEAGDATCVHNPGKVRSVVRIDSCNAHSPPDLTTGMDGRRHVGKRVGAHLLLLSCTCIIAACCQRMQLRSEGSSSCPTMAGQCSTIAS